MTKIPNAEAKAMLGTMYFEPATEYILIVPTVSRVWFDDVAARYLVGLAPDIPGGCIIYAESHGSWHVNPYSVRGLVTTLLGLIAEIA